MAKITVSCLPEHSGDTFDRLHRNIVETVAGIPPLGLRSEADMLIEFTVDHLRFGHVRDVHVQVSHLWDLRARTVGVRQLLANNLRLCVQHFYSKTPDIGFSAGIDPPASYAAHSFASNKKGWSHNSYWKGWYVGDYFSDDRLGEFDIDQRQKTRIRNAMMHNAGGETAVMGTLLRTYMNERLQIPNFGDASRGIVEGMLKLDGFI